MALIDAFLKKTVRIKPYVRDAGGEIIYGKEEQRKCRICLLYTSPAAAADSEDGEGTGS